MDRQDANPEPVVRAVEPGPIGALSRAVPRVPLREPFATWPTVPLVGEPVARGHREGETPGVHLSVVHAGGGDFGTTPPAPPTASETPSGGSVPPPRRTSHVRGAIAAFAALALGAGVAIGYGAFSGGSGSTGSVASTSASVSTPAATVDPGLVDVDSVLGYTTARAAGTGMVLTSTGIVLTNNHVIEGATSISVTDVGNGQTYKATVVGYDVSKDVAVIRLVDASGLSTVSIGNSSSASVGETVVAIGNAGGTGGTPHVARGSVTALGQSIIASDAGSTRTEQLNGLIETDADIQAGDSGGPLVTSSGEVVAMDTAASSTGGPSFSTSSTTTQGYAIPINTAMTVAKEIESGTKSSTVHLAATAFLGVRVESGGSATGATGAYVVGALRGSPATSAGLAAGDVITEVGGSTATSATSLSTLLERYHPGQSVTVTWTTATGKSTSAKVKLATGPVG